MKCPLAPILWLMGIVGIYGCSESPDQKLVGQWTGKAEVTDQQIDALVKSKGVTGERAELMRKMMKEGGMDLHLKEDKTYEMNMMMVPVKGTWSRRDQQVTLLPTEVAGMKVADVVAKFKSKDAAKAVVFTASARFDELVALSDPAMPSGELVLRKRGQ